MNNYFFDTPVYKIWIDLIGYMSPRTSFLIETFQYRFVELVCKREDVVKAYESKGHRLDLVYAHENRRFFCRMVDIKNGVPIMWKTTPPTPNLAIKNFFDLQKEIDKWLEFLKGEL